MVLVGLAGCDEGAPLPAPDAAVAADDAGAADGAVDGAPPPPDARIGPDGGPDPIGCVVRDMQLWGGWFTVTASESVRFEGMGEVVQRSPTLAQIALDVGRPEPVMLDFSADAALLPALALGARVEVALWAESDDRRSDVAVVVRDLERQVLVAAYVGPAAWLDEGVFAGPGFLGAEISRREVCAGPVEWVCVAEATYTALALRFAGEGGVVEAEEGGVADLMLGVRRYRAYVESARAVDGRPDPGCSDVVTGPWVAFFMLPR
ncbi:MAG: hypothetical protein H6703_03635 [Myxococcales bacterium]|nr:hypothetical protein [Myxococcales bacterium]MCB9541523.1 hypothetical protein [Myxococcales bacterium]